MAGAATKLGIRAMRANLGNAWKNDRRVLVKSITAWILFSGIIVVFIFLGQSPQHAGVAAGGTAASVNGQIVSIAEFSEQVEMMSRDPRFAQLEQFGGDFARQMIRKQAIGALVDQRLLGQNLGKMGLVTPDAQVRDSIAEIPAFQEEGRFSKTRYLGYLQATRQSPSEFEEKLRRQLATNRAARTFQSALRPLPFEADLVKAVEGKKANIEAVTIPTETLVIADGVPQAEVKAFLAKSDAAARVKSYYDSHKADFAQAEKAKVRHILIRTEKAKPESVATAKAEAAKILAAVKGGADFAKLATEKSQDPGSKTNGGLIDYFAKGAMVPEFEKFAFSAKPGEISDLVQTDFGFHIIKLEDRKPATDKKLEEVQEDIAQILVAQEQSRDQIAALEKALAAGNASEVQAFVQKHKLNWRESGAFPLNAETIPQVGGGDEAVSLAFKLTSDKPLAAKLVRQGPQAILMRYKSVPPESAKVTAKNAKGAPALPETPEVAAETAASRRIDEAFGSWMDVLRKNATISINPEVASRGETPTE
jgi:peptidyl-prolyl cis-trans isomerase D